jgi:hypothetical protein
MGPLFGLLFLAVRKITPYIIRNLAKMSIMQQLTHGDVWNDVLIHLNYDAAATGTIG